MYIDTHCHLDFPEFDSDRDEVIRRAQEAGIEAVVNIGSSLQASRKSLELASRHDFIYAAIGIHPHEADRFDKEQENELAALLKQEKAVAVGEIGLDYFKNYSQGPNQRKLFRALLKLAKEADLPLVIHSRNAQADTLAILKEESVGRAVVHCFSGGEDFLKECLALGFFISFTCNITYRNAADLRNLVKMTPLDRLMLETDAPFLAPEPLRGKRNEPLHVRTLAEEISRIKEIPLDEVAEATTKNAKGFFRLDSR
jgi:TatD DNase family protein